MMKIYPAIVIAIGLLGAPAVSGQEDSVSIPSKKGASQWILPAALVSYGILAHTVEPFRKVDKYIDDKMESLNRHTSFDNYLQYAPAVAVYGLDLCGVKAKHNLRDRTIILASSYLLEVLTVNAIKYTANVPRPTGAAHNSFPSGHTATVFTGAHILFREYKDTSPWIGIAGYAAATTTGAMRVMNRKHWLGDVAAGAGTAILCVEASYLLLPLFQKVMKVPANIVALPAVGNNSYGIGLVYFFPTTN